MEINWLNLVCTIVVGIPAIVLAWWTLFFPQQSKTTQRLEDARQYRQLNSFSCTEDPTVLIPGDYVELEYQYTETLTNTLVGTITDISEESIIIRPDTAQYGNMCGQNFTVGDWQFVKSQFVDPQQELGL